MAYCALGCLSLRCLLENSYVFFNALLSRLKPPLTVRKQRACTDISEL